MLTNDLFSVSSNEPAPVHRFRVNRASKRGERWLVETLNREGQKFGTRVEHGPDHTFLLRWS